MKQSQYIEKIIKSPTFENSHQLINLLTYLYDAKQKNRTIKEIDIAHDVFHRTKDFNPNEDTIVRVNISKLRKKLAAYYANEGKTDKFRCQIPKGHYRIQFFTRPFSSVLQYKFSIIFTLLLLLIPFSIFLFIQNKSMVNDLQRVKMIPQSNPIWNEFLNRKLPVIIALGDHFFYTMQDNIINQRVFVRNYRVNSREEFKTLLEHHPKIANEYKELEHTFFVKSTVWPTPVIYSLIHPHHNNIQLRIASHLNPEDMKQNNIIFVGNMKTIGNLKFLLDLSTIKWNFVPEFFSFCPEDSDTSISVSPEGPRLEYNTKYSFVVKVPGPMNNTVFLICDFTGYSNIGAAEYLADPDRIRQLENMFIEKYGNVPPYFELVLKIKGFYRTNFHAEVIHYQKIEPRKQ